MSRSEEQAARNEAAFRDANERIAEKTDELELGDGPMPFLCECEDERCTQIVLLRRSEYEDVRAHPRRFVVSPGHEDGDARLIEDGDFAVIEKRGKEGALVEQQDPRSSA